MALGETEAVEVVRKNASGSKLKKCFLSFQLQHICQKHLLALLHANFIYQVVEVMVLFGRIKTKYLMCDFLTNAMVSTRGSLAKKTARQAKITK